MCGIAGAIALKSATGGLSGPLDCIVESMAKCITHRGPDGSGLWKSPSGRIALAHRRLAIIDLTETGRQPMEYGGRFWATFNGEIYNFKDLRAELLAFGHTFRGESDTEVLLGAIAQWGIEGALSRCVGMFALAVWDARDQILHLARDRMGEKPLYLGEIHGHLFFASELRAFRSIPEFDARVSGRAASAYLRDGCVPGALSMYEGIYKLPPGHILTVRSDRGLRMPGTWPHMDKSSGDALLTPRPYWSCRDASERGLDSQISDSRAAVEQGEELLRQAVRLQMHADVPTGAFLSGGIDSSLVTAVMQHQSSQPVRTFTIGFDDPRFDESHHARAIAEHLGTRHEEFPIRQQDIVDQIPSIVHHMDEPTANGSFFPVYLISRIARTQVTVALSGDGGDELFAGYNRYVLAPHAWRRTRWVPLSMRRQIAALLARSGSTSDWWLIGKMARLGSQIGSRDALQKLARILSSQTFVETYTGLTSWWAGPSILEQNTEPPPRQWPEMFADDLQSMLLADQVNYLPDDNLSKVDRASMATSLETRLPLLDHRFVEFSWRLPADLKLRGRTTKWLLRTILGRYVPRALFERPKMGFTVPIDKWLRGPLREWASDMVSGSALPRNVAVRPGELQRIWDEYLQNRGCSANEMWALIVLAAWADSVMSNSPVSGLSGRPLPMLH